MGPLRFFLTPTPKRLLPQLAAVKHWLRAHQSSHRCEYHAFDAVLTLWMLGWVSSVPCIVLGWWWMLPVSAVAAYLPLAYLLWRTHWHAQGRLRADWLVALN